MVHELIQCTLRPRSYIYALMRTQHHSVPGFRNRVVEKGPVDWLLVIVLALKPRNQLIMLVKEIAFVWILIQALEVVVAAAVEDTRVILCQSRLHRKQCIQSFNVFDFLKDVVSRVPDLGGTDAGAESATKRRKIAKEDGHDSSDDIKSNHMPETANTNSSGRGRGRDRGRGRGRRALERGDSKCSQREA